MDVPLHPWLGIAGDIRISCSVWFAGDEEGLWNTLRELAAVIEGVLDTFSNYLSGSQTEKLTEIFASKNWGSLRKLLKKAGQGAMGEGAAGKHPKHTYRQRYLP
jgi:hypothetical protein